MKVKKAVSGGGPVLTVIRARAGTDVPKRLIAKYRLSLEQAKTEKGKDADEEKRRDQREEEERKKIPLELDSWIRCSACNKQRAVSEVSPCPNCATDGGVTKRLPRPNSLPPRSRLPMLPLPPPAPALHAASEAVTTLLVCTESLNLTPGCSWGTRE